MNFKNIFLIIGLFLINACDSSSSPTAPTGPATTTIVSMAVGNVPADFAGNSSAHVSFRDAVAGNLGLTSTDFDKVSILQVDTRRADVTVKLGFEDAGGITASELIDSALDITDLAVTIDGTVYNCSVVAITEQAVIDCAGEIDGDAVEDVCGVCEGDSSSCPAGGDAYCNQFTDESTCDDNDCDWEENGNICLEDDSEDGPPACFHDCDGIWGIDPENDFPGLCIWLNNAVNNTNCTSDCTGEDADFINEVLSQCDGSSDSDSDLYDLLQGTWDTVESCSTGQFFTSIVEGESQCLSTDTCAWINQTITISGYNLTICINGDCNVMGYTLDGNTMNFTHPDPNITLVNMQLDFSDDGQSGTTIATWITGSASGFSCNGTQTTTWAKR